MRQAEAPFWRIGLTWGANVAGTHEMLAGQGIETAAASPHSGLRDAADARRYLRVTLFHTLAIYAALAAAMAGVVPATLLVAALPWIYVRLSLALHELLHV